MKNKRYLLCLAFLGMLLIGGMSAFADEPQKETLVLINTNMGKIKVKLYNDTPLHRENFIKHVNNKLYDGLLFHRVIRMFMIQAGDVNSKGAAPDVKLGEGDMGYTIPAEFMPEKHFHRRGALCAARTSDDVNPDKASSGSQFYIVTGKHYSEMDIDKYEKANNHKFTDEQRQAYMIDGGTPHLDGNYTVFGEVVSGMKVVDKIQFVETNLDDRPSKDVVIKSMKIVKK